MAFVGLIAPHISRRLAGVEHRYILPLSGLIGIFACNKRRLCRKTVFQPAEVPAGIILAILGVPYFLYLLLSKKGRMLERIPFRA